MAYINNSGVNIYYSTAGIKDSREVLVFLTGSGSDSSIWKKQINYLKNEYFIIAIDNRGSGKSDCPEYKYDAAMFCSDMEEILKAEGIESFNLVGFSMGGLIAQKYVNDTPHRVKRLILINCTLGAGNPDTVPPSQDVINIFLFSAALTPEDIARSAMDYNFGSSFKEEHPESYERYFQSILKNTIGVNHHVPVMVSNERLIQDYAKIKMPVLAILSEKDPVVPLGNGRVIKKHLPQAQIKYLDGYHASMLIHPDKVNQIIGNFLKYGI
jgi:3-oxoadipate enol-lactonase